MTTALDIISRALRLIGVYATGEAPTGAEANEALAVLNSLIQSYGNQSLLIFSESSDTIPFAANQGSTTIGPTGTVVSGRPVALLDNSYVQLGEVSYPLQRLTDAEYSAITLKGLMTGIPSMIYVETTMPDSKVILYPTPSQAVVLNLRSHKRLTTISTLADVLVFPDGYDRMFASCLAIDLAPEYERQVSADLRLMATNARRVLKRTNKQIGVLDMPVGIPMGYGCNNVFGGGQGANAIVTTDGEFIVYTP